MSQARRAPDADAGALAPGLRCPSCGCSHFEVIYTRQDVGTIRRRRECRHCGRRVTTREQLVG